MSRLPSPFAISTPSRQIDDDGKVRTFDHERGQWACHVYADADEDIHSRVADCLNTNGDSSSSMSFKMIPDPHFSLFRGNCVIRHHHIDPVVRLMQQKLSKLHSFTLPLKQIRTLQNDDHSRSFVCVCCDNGSCNTKLQRVLSAVKECLKDFTTVHEYEDEFIPHVSLLWFTGSHNHPDHDHDGVQAAIQALEQEFGENPLLVRVKNINLKIGNRCYAIDMKNT